MYVKNISASAVTGVTAPDSCLPPLHMCAPQAYIVANTSSSAKPKDIPWRLLLSRKEVWAIILCHFCHNWGTFILLTWMPTYYNQVSLTQQMWALHSSWLCIALTASH